MENTLPSKVFCSSGRLISILKLNLFVALIKSYFARIQGPAQSLIHSSSFKFVWKKKSTDNYCTDNHDQRSMRAAIVKFFCYISLRIQCQKEKLFWSLDFSLLFSVFDTCSKEAWFPLPILQFQ